MTRKERAEQKKTVVLASTRPSEHFYTQRRRLDKLISRDAFALSAFKEPLALADDDRPFSESPARILGSTLVCPNRLDAAHGRLPCQVSFARLRLQEQLSRHRKSWRV